MVFSSAGETVCDRLIHENSWQMPAHMHRIHVHNISRYVLVNINVRHHADPRTADTLGRATEITLNQLAHMHHLSNYCKALVVVDSTAFRHSYATQHQHTDNRIYPKQVNPNPTQPNHTNDHGDAVHGTTYTPG